MRLFTSRYGDRRLKSIENLVKVGISLGRPKWVLDYPITWFPLIAPTPAILADKHSPETYTPAYIDELERIGVPAIREQLDMISNANDGRDLVLLCYENVWKGAFCHRRLFADWWFSKTGEVVEELPEEPSAPKKKSKDDTQPSLF